MVIEEKPSLNLWEGFFMWFPPQAGVTNSDNLVCADSIEFDFYQLRVVSLLHIIL